MSEESCCYGARVVAGRNVPGGIIRKIIERWPTVGLGTAVVEVKRIETNEVRYFFFVGLGLGVRFTPIYINNGPHTVICCDDADDCPDFDDFSGFGRFTVANAQVGVGGHVAFIDFGTEEDCRLYFEVGGLTFGAGLALGTYIGYYYEI